MRNRLRLYSLAIVGAIALLLSGQAWSQAVTWGAATNIAGNTDVSTSGSLVYAYAWDSSAGAASVNGVPFTITNSTAGSGDGNVTFSWSGIETFAPHTGNPFSALSTSYQSILGAIVDNYSSSSPVTLKNLTSGQSYTVQVWVNQSYYGSGYTDTLSTTGGNSVTLQFQTGGGSTGGVGQYAIGTFTASGSTETINFAAGSFLGLSALQVRTAGSGGNPPVITSASSANGTVGSSFSYQITATNSPTSYGATGLPAGLSVNTSTGAITGTPSASGTSTVGLSATNAYGRGTLNLTLTVAAAGNPPVITSASSATGTVSDSFSYQITATNGPTSFNATNLPSGLSVNTTTGAITGTPSASGTSTVALSATNAYGTGTLNLTLTIQSGGSQAVTWGAATNIAADTDVSTSGSLVYAYAWDTTSGGFTVNTVPFTVTNSTSGSGDGNVTFSGWSGIETFAPHTGNPFSALSTNYQGILGAIVDTYSGSSPVTLHNLSTGQFYTVQVWVNQSYYGAGFADTLSTTGGNSVTLQFQTGGGSTGGLGQYAIGTFTASGPTETINFASGNNFLGLSALLLRVGFGGAPIITSASSANGTVGGTFSYQITATNTPTSFSATNLPSGLGINPSTGAITGLPTAAGTSTVGLSATNAYGTGTLNLTITVSPLAANCTGVSAPAPAAAAGYTSLVFCDDFTSTSTIDVNGTGNAGYNWYTRLPFGGAQTLPSAYSVANSVLTITSTGLTGNWGLTTRDPYSGNGSAWTFGYFEASVNFNPNLGPDSEGWPSFWSLGAYHTEYNNSDIWPELDFFEAYTGGESSYSGAFVGTLHQWQNSGSINYQNSNNYQNTSVNWNNWHTLGFLWVPGQVSWYLDGNLLMTQEYSATAPPNPLANTAGGITPTPAGVFDILDTAPLGEQVIVGSSPGWPLNIDYVRVWRQ
jgi:hypothetical protein